MADVATVRERPILFSVPMVRAIQADLKTQTRRVCRLVNPRSMEATARCPYGVPGDRLWVREAWAAVGPSELRTLAAVRLSECRIEYRAELPARPGPSRWRPSIHMPRWASRITLAVVSVRVERLHDISEDDALAEGVDPFEWPGGPANPSARGAYAELWDAINGKRAPWSSNPWVWAIGFNRVEATQAGAAHG